MMLDRMEKINQWNSQMMALNQKNNSTSSSDTSKCPFFSHPHLTSSRATGGITPFSDYQTGIHFSDITGADTDTFLQAIDHVPQSVTESNMPN